MSLMFSLSVVDISRAYLRVHDWQRCLTLIYRYIVKLQLRRLRKKGFNRQFVLILGGRFFRQTFL